MSGSLPATPAGVTPPPALGAPGQIVQLGVMRAAGLNTVLDEARRAAELTQAQPFISSLAAHVRQSWITARQAKQATVEPRMLANLRARRGEYSPEKLAQIREQGGSDVFAGVTSAKCRAASAWLRDVLLGSGSDKPWTIGPTPVPELPPQVNDALVEQATQAIMAAMQSGQMVSQAQVVELMQSLKAQTLESTREYARKTSERMEAKMEDQLAQGGFLNALDAFFDDLTVFPSAIIKGPIVRRRPALTWQNANGTMVPVVQDQLKLEWERVNPFHIYPSPSSTTVDNGYLIERHKLTASDLEALIGVDGYDDNSIRAVLDQYGRGGLREWLTNDVAQADAQGQSAVAVAMNPDHLIDALQYWGTVQGKCLIDWGMDIGVDDPTKFYHVEAWLIGAYVIKAVLNYDPLHRKPYYKASYEEIPGNWWGNSVADLVRDSQQVCNAAARAVVNNMAMASGPQVGVNVNRLADGEDITTLTPWRIWQVTSDPTGNSGVPLQFFQPNSHVQELLLVFERFSQMADEYSGIPRYLTGDTTGGAGRTASGLSMLIGNAGKSIKQVVANIDNSVLTPLLERLYFHNMRYADDPDLKGDVQIVARGAASLIAKDAAAVRRNEFLAATMNPIDSQIIGIEGRAALLRESAKALDVNPDKVVPPLDVLRQRLAAQAMMMQSAQPQQPGAQTIPGPSPSGQNLQDGAPVTDNFGPPRQ